MGTDTPLATLPRPEDPVRRGTEYSDLMSRVKTAGLLNRRPGYYLIKIAAIGTVFAGGWVAFVLLGDSWWQLAVAALMAAVFTQIGFIGHDAGHRQIFRSRRANYVVGLLHGNLAIGLSYGWWVDKHNRHHAHPNQEGKDPDVAIGALAFTTEQANAKSGRVTRFIARHQRYMFFPLLLLEAVQLHKSSVQAVLRRRLRNRSWEALTLGLHAAGYLTATLLVLSPVKALAFIAVHQALFGLYLGCSFAPNHKGMPMLSADDQADFLRRQVLTSRNVRGGWLIDFTLGGLNYQIEHHLFPSMPRPNLRRAQSLVRAFCQRHGIPYCETTLLRSYAQTLRHMHEVGRPLRAASAA
ncbi:MAG TPA: acyl-CoA desaturase [Micromonosporaceae bacterium]|nr:acyl-CoA desaturase [Micromonosporaceae bacterium]